MLFRSKMAGWTSLELATSCVTGKRSGPTELPPREIELPVDSNHVHRLSGSYIETLAVSLTAVLFYCQGSSFSRQHHRNAW